MWPQATRLPGWLAAAQPLPQRSNHVEVVVGMAAVSVTFPARAAVVVLVPLGPIGMMLPPRMNTGVLSVRLACKIQNYFVEGVVQDLKQAQCIGNCRDDKVRSLATLIRPQHMR